MLFNSIDFAVFLPIVFILYWFVTNHNLKFQNALIVVSSYIFYGWWDWRFLSLILFSTLLDFCIGVGMSRLQTQHKRKTLLWVSIIVNLGFLAYFKYFNFFVDSFVTAFTFFGQDIGSSSLNIILPVGISFYTFQTLSYTIDVYKKELEATRSFIDFAAFVSFFPQLVAGPIERATNLLPQFYVKREFNYTRAIDGLRQILWGLFKKIVIADSCAQYANLIFNNSEEYNGAALALGAIFFTFQIYGDFSGYSDIAIGTSRLFGFNLMRNFAFPYFSRDAAEFWRRWHISLSTWFRDYVYIPLGGSRGGMGMKVRNTFIIFIVSGFWHGANWTFVIWGLLNAIYFLPLLVLKRNRQNLEIVAQGRLFPNMNEIGSMVSTFSLTVFAWIFFRAESVSHALSYISTIFSSSLFAVPNYPDVLASIPVMMMIIVFLIIEWLGREGQYAISNFGLGWSRPVRWAFYYSIALIIFFFSGSEQEFIYFQF